MAGIYIWGTGCSAGELCAALPERVELAGFVDSFPMSDTFMDKPVLRPEQLCDAAPELVIVSARAASAILDKCLELGIERDVLLFTKNSVRLEDMNSSYAAAERLLGSETVAALIPKYAAVREPMKQVETPLGPRDYENDYVRIKTLELVCRRLEDVPGAAAELGVYKGGFARCINALMPGRRLYLFDTFEGFESSEAMREMRLGNLSAGVDAAHKNTSLDKVMSLMPHPRSVQPMVGYFPESLGGLEDKFAFVSLDADLEESTLSGLEYFVPRMSAGGYIFLHDYDSHSFAGVRKAVERYEKAHDLKFRALPLCDVNGTLVLCF